jgi:hypothetical protein
MRQCSVTKEINGIKYRKCAHCHEFQPLSSEYYYHRSKENGTFQNECIQCCSEYSKERKLSNKNTKKYRLEHVLDSTAIGRAVEDSMRPIDQEIL